MGRLTHSRRATVYVRSLRNVVANWYGAPSAKQLIGNFPIADSSATVSSWAQTGFITTMVWGALASGAAISLSF